jgi:hypothetical protein
VSPPPASDAPSRWSSNLLFLIIAIGTEAGIANVWKFSYLAGANGGRSVLGTMQVLVARDGIAPFWRTFGIMATAAVFLILSYYCVICGWMVNYFVGMALAETRSQKPRALDTGQTVTRDLRRGIELSRARRRHEAERRHRLDLAQLHRARLFHQHRRRTVVGARVAVGDDGVVPRQAWRAHDGGVIVDIGAAKANYETVYGHTALAAIAAGVIMFLLAPLLKKLMHGEVAHGEVAHRTVMNGERKH